MVKRTRAFIRIVAQLMADPDKAWYGYDLMKASRLSLRHAVRQPRSDGRGRMDRGRVRDPRRSGQADAAGLQSD